MDKSIFEILNELITLLEMHGEHSWAYGFRNSMNEFHFSPTEAKSKIRRVYGGMGSFNDLVLQDKTGFLPAENEELSRLRHELYAACSK